MSNTYIFPFLNVVTLDQCKCYTRLYTWFYRRYPIVVRLMILEAIDRKEINILKSKSESLEPVVYNNDIYYFK